MCILWEHHPSFRNQDFGTCRDKSCMNRKFTFSNGSLEVMISRNLLLPSCCFWPHVFYLQDIESCDYHWGRVHMTSWRMVPVLVKHCLLLDYSWALNRPFLPSIKMASSEWCGTWYYRRLTVRHQHTCLLGYKVGTLFNSKPCRNTCFWVWMLQTYQTKREGILPLAI